MGLEEAGSSGTIHCEPMEGGGLSLPAFISAFFSFILERSVLLEAVFSTASESLFDHLEIKLPFLSRISALSSLLCSTPSTMIENGDYSSSDCSTSNDSRFISPILLCILLIATEAPLPLMSE